MPYTEEALLTRHRIEHLSQLSSRRTGRESVDDGLDLLTQLFVDGHYAARAQIASLLPPELFDLLASLGLLARSAYNPEVWAATVMLYPRAGLYFTSDRARQADGTPMDDMSDIVFSALTEDTERFLDLLPEEHCDTLLDLGTGSGVAALIAAGSARHVWAVDITERAATFAEFNRRLNGLDNVTVLRGDLCAPVEGLRFDRILLHPPYVPALRQSLIYQDAGLDGQDVTRRAVGELSSHLNPGGRFYCLTVGVDCEGAPFEQAVRSWLHSGGADFDVVFVARHVISVGFIARSVALKSGHGAAGAARLEQAFERLRIHEFVYGAILVQRHTTARPGFTLRRQHAAAGGRGAISWLLRWETELASRGPEWLLDTRPGVSPHMEFLVTHRMVDGELAPIGYRLVADRPFGMEARAAAWMGGLIARSNGATTVRDHFTQLREQGAFPPDVGLTDFARVVGQLVSGGFLWIPGFEPST